MFGQIVCVLAMSYSFLTPDLVSFLPKDQIPGSDSKTQVSVLSTIIILPYYYCSLDFLDCLSKRMADVSF